MVWLWWLWWFWWFLVVVVVLGELDVLVVVAAIRRYRGPALRPAGEMGNTRAGMSVCDAISGVHAMTTSGASRE